MKEQLAENGAIRLAFDTVGDPTATPLLLVIGVGGQLISWPDAFRRRLAGRGFCVARLDNRDAGRSTHLDGDGRPNQVRMLLRPASAAVYRLEDMAGDAFSVLDALGWPAAHVVGRSQGGMIAQTMAAERPERVLSLTSISSTAAPRVGQPGPRGLLRMLRMANPTRIRDAEGLGQYLVELQGAFGSPAYPADEEELRELGRRCYERGGLEVAAVQRQTAAIAASGDRRAALGRLRLPTLVLHGEADRLIGVVGARATADAIPGARLVTYPGMGHDLPEPLWDAIIDEIVGIAAAARPGSAGAQTVTAKDDARNE